MDNEGRSGTIKAAMKHVALKHYAFCTEDWTEGPWLERLGSCYSAHQV